MALHRWMLIGLLGVAGLAFWLLVAGPSQLLGIDTGNAGMVLLSPPRGARSTRSRGCRAATPTAPSRPASGRPGSGWGSCSWRSA
ncbi:MAG: hypothetical protein ACYC42_00005, partial [Lysobacter sp.]